MMRDDGGIGGGGVKIFLVATNKRSLFKTRLKSLCFIVLLLSGLLTKVK